MNKCECGCGASVKNRFVSGHNLLTVEHSEIVSKSQRENWQNEKYRKTVSKALKAKWRDQERREAARKKLKEQWQDEEYREKILSTLCSGKNRIAVSTRMRLDNPMINPSDVVVWKHRMGNKYARIMRK